MNTFQKRDDQGRIILYDPRLTPDISADWFDLQHWQAQDALLGGAPGRGTSAFIRTPAGEAVWRHYHRGGLPGRFIRDRYLWTGLENTRAWQELHLTRQLLDRGLPVPVPLAAAIHRNGLVYSADLITLRLPDVVPLADWLAKAETSGQPALLEQVGQAIQPFHAAGLDHVDLNPRNLLINPTTRQVWLIDFDRCRLGQPDARVAENNLQRLERGLVKIDPAQASQWMGWIRQGYQQKTATGLSKKA